jgi:hypothetical protein
VHIGIASVDDLQKPAEQVPMRASIFSQSTLVMQGYSQ